MNTVYARRSNVRGFIEQLLAEPYFQDGTLTMYADVPIKCLHYTPIYSPERENLCSAPDKYRFEAFDYLICRGNCAIVCISFNYSHTEVQEKEIFSRYLPGLDCMAHSAEKLSTEELEQFAPFVREHLRRYAEADSYCTDYELDVVKTSENLVELAQGCLLGNYGYSPIYRRDCGIFYRCYLEEDDSLCQDVLTCTKDFEEHSNALNWKVTNNPDAAALKRMLNMPLAEFFGSHIAELTELHNLLDRAGHLNSFPKRQVITYQDCLKFLYDMTQTAFIGINNRRELFRIKADIQKCLSKVVKDGELDFFQLPLHRYYHAAANLAGCYYPIWLYRNVVRPRLCNGSEDITMSEVAGFIVSNLLVEPICIPSDPHLRGAIHLTF